MSFQAYNIARWTKGSTLVAEPDAIPDDALRIAQNVRLSRVLGAPSVRPGWVRRSIADFTSAIVYLSRLFTRTATYGYAQVGAVLYRLTSTWDSASALYTVGTQVVSEANSPDGNGTLWKYFVTGTAAIKDYGITTFQMGIAAPTSLGITAALAADLFTTISFMDNAADWTGFNLTSGPTGDGTNYQTGTVSISFAAGPSTFFGIAQFFAADINLDTLTGGDALVKDDDYIHLWVRVDHPEFLTLMQIDIDVDAASTSVADAFRHNYYSATLGALAVLSQGANQWTEVQVRKSEFARYGTDATRTWAHAQGIRIGFLTSSLGGVTINVDDIKLRGGVGLEGDYKFTLCYRNASTKGRGNPPKDSDFITLYTAPITVNRQRINLTITNVIQGGVNHPGDGQIDTIMLWMQGGIFETAVLVDEIPDTATSPYLVSTSQETLVLQPLFLELDNDIPPAGTTRVLFGPDATGHFFMIVDGYRLYISKSYEDKENRVENWPRLGFAIIGDGSYRAVAGIAQSTQIFVWTTALKYNVVGVGEGNYLPVAQDGTRGAVGQFAVTSGDDRIFSISQDGIYEHTGHQEAKLTGAIDPFFQGLTVDGQPGWDTRPEFMALARLEFLHDATGSMLVMLYAEKDTGFVSRHLVLKPNLQDGRLTEAFFDRSNMTALQSLFLDNLSRELLGGGLDGIVYRIEDPNAYTDSGFGIDVRLRSKSYDFQQPQHGKYISHTTFEGNTSNQSVVTRLWYDRGATHENMGYFTTGTEVGRTLLPGTFPTTSRHDVAFELSGSFLDRFVLTRFGCLYEVQPEPQMFLDSGLVSFDFMQQLKRFEWDIDLPAQGQLSIYADGGLICSRTFIATVGRRNVPFPLPAGLAGRIWRVTLLAPEAFLCYRMSGFFKQLGVDSQYIEKVLVQGV